MNNTKTKWNIAIAVVVGVLLMAAILVGIYFAIQNVDEEGCLGGVVFVFDVLLSIALAGYILLIAAKLRLIRSKVLRQAAEIVNLYGFIGLASAGIIFIIALVLLCIHSCPVSIAAFVTSVVLCLLYAMLFFAMEAQGEIKAFAAQSVKAEPKKEAVKAKEPESVVEAVNAQDENAFAQQEEYEDEDDDDEEIIISDYKGNIFRIQYNKSFTAKLAQSPDYLKGYYAELKNEILSYKKTTSRVSWYYDSINSGRKQLIKFSIRGKTLCVYYALNADDFKDTNYLVEKVETKKFETVPCLYRIKNDLRVRHAKELMAMLMEKEGFVKGEQQNEDYYIKYETTQALINKELIKELRMPATEEELKKAERKKLKRLKSVTVQQANEMVENEVAKESIIDQRTGKYTGKKDIINIDVLSRNYNDGDTVTLESLKNKKLIDKSIGQVKVLARGVLDKKLNIELQDYSIEAVKMILLTGGTATRV